MIQPLEPGSRLGQWKIRELISWGTRGGVYRAEGAIFLKELLFPPGLSESERTARRLVLQGAVDLWTQVDSPLALPGVELFQDGDRIFLKLPEVEGSTLKVQSRFREAAPEPVQSVRWADQVAELVELLLQQNNPLAFEILDSDRMLIDGEGRLTVFNPGWSQLLWQEHCDNLQEGIQRYGDLLLQMASGDVHQSPNPAQLPAGLIWIVSRCQSPQQDRCYRDFSEIRRALRNVKLSGEEGRNMRTLGRLPTLFRFSLPRLGPVARYPRRAIAFFVVLFVVLALAAGWMWKYWMRPLPLRPGHLVASGRELYLVNSQGRQRISRFSEPILALAPSRDGTRIYVACQGAEALWVLDTDEYRARRIDIESPVRDLVAPGHDARLLVHLASGRWLVFGLNKKSESRVGSLRVPDGLNPWVAHPLGMLTGIEQPDGLRIYQADKVLYSSAPASYHALLPVESLWLAASNQGVLDVLSPSLRLQRRLKLPAASGEVTLLAVSNALYFWSLQQIDAHQLTIGRWSIRQWACEAQVTVDSQATLSCVDEQGNLCWIDEQHRLQRLLHNSFQHQVLATLPARPSALAYLVSDRRSKGLQRLIDGQ